MKKRIFGVAGVTVACLTVLANNAMAMDWTSITAMDLTDVDALLKLVVVGLIAIWGYRKVIKLANRS